MLGDQLIAWFRYINLYNIGKKNLFLTIQLLPQYDFDHQTPKPGIFNHPTFKTVHN
jgi:hypothetical protein